MIILIISKSYFFVFIYFQITLRLKDEEDELVAGRKPAGDTQLFCFVQTGFCFFHATAKKESF